MKIEKQLAKTDLNQFKQKPLEIVVKGIYKHQRFKTNEIIKRINCVHYKENTVKTYAGIIRGYLNNGTKQPYYDEVYSIVDKLKSQHEAILTPPKDLEYVANKSKSKHKKSDPLPSPTPQVEIEPEPQKLVEVLPTQYGIKTENTIKLFLSKECCDAYIQAYREFDKDKELEVVKLKYRVIE